jgi:glycerate dehydrogenase
MKIVVVDGYPLNPGDISWQGFTALGECEIYEHSTPDTVVSRCRDAEVVLTNKVVFDAAVLAQLPKLKYLGVTATGVNVVDLQAAARQGIVVTNTAGYGTLSVAHLCLRNCCSGRSRWLITGRRCRRSAGLGRGIFVITITP